MIDTAQRLAEFLPVVRSAPWLALDTEADSLHSYPEKLCLLQLSVPEADVLVDPLAGLDLGPLVQALDGREIILHGGDYDLRLLKRSLGYIPASIFDTMLAARLLGVTAFGLTVLVERFLGIKLEKGSQKADWGRRPLTERMVVYARNDTRHLKPLAEKLAAELEAKGRREWHRQTCRQFLEDAVQESVVDPDSLWRIGGAERMDRRSMAFLRELWHWREQEAIGSNRPPFFVLSHQTLVAVAVASARGHDPQTLLPLRFSPRRRAGVMEALKRARELPESQWPHHRRRPRKSFGASAKIRMEALKERRDRHAARLELDPSLIASRATLIALAADWEQNHVQLLPWQRELLQS